jgi:hypothetical protein
MGGFFLKGVDGHVGKGMPWAFQNGRTCIVSSIFYLPCCVDIHFSFWFLVTGLVCATFYHFFVHDKTGVLGTTLREAIPSSWRLGLSEETFAAVVVSLFMQITGILQMPIVFGPDFSPFSVLPLFRKFLSGFGHSPNQENIESKQKLAKGRSKGKEKNT